MRRRAFITLLGGAVAAWPRAARAQQSMPLIGYLSGRSAATEAHRTAAFHQGLKETGYVEGQNVAIEYRWTEGQFNRLPAFTADLVGRRVAVIFAADSNSARTAKAATTTIPIVFYTGADPVQAGLVVSFRRPGGNATGVYVFSGVLAPKRLELLREMIPKVAVIAFLVRSTNTTNTGAEAQSKELEEAARAIGVQLFVAKAGTENEIDLAFASIVQRGADALLVGADVFFTARRDRLVALAARHAIPTIYALPEFAEAGGLMSYGADRKDAFHQAGIYTGRILKGERPADLPVMQSTKFELVINLKAAKALGLTVPRELLLRADEVIE
ncbi:MAG: ABC transporter substrate-binding protein [Proteobacteria bacterium]|nr:ABC transporter substrate-binding protein [Pseudomonadota bacterium]